MEINLLNGIHYIVKFSVPLNIMRLLEDLYAGSCSFASSEIYAANKCLELNTTHDSVIINLWAQIV